MELDEKLGDLDNAPNNLPLSCYIHIDTMHIDTKNLNNTDSFVCELFLFKMWFRELKHRITALLIKIHYAIFLCFRKGEAVSIV